MKKFLVTGIFLMGTINGCLAQVVRPLHNSHVVYKPFDIGLSLTSYIDSGRPGLYYYDENGASSIVDLHQSTFAVSVPISLEYNAVSVVAEFGYKQVLYTPEQSTNRTAFAERIIEFPLTTDNGYLCSHWASCSLSVGFCSTEIDLIKAGFSIDFFLDSTKKDNPYFHFVSVGNNSYSRLVPSFYWMPGFSTAHFRINLRVGFQARGYLDGVRLFKTTGHEQNRFKDGFNGIAGLSIIYKIFTTYGKYDQRHTTSFLSD